MTNVVKRLRGDYLAPRRSPCALLPVENKETYVQQQQNKKQNKP